MTATLAALSKAKPLVGHTVAEINSPMAAVGSPNGDCQEHHICTDKNNKSSKQGGPWTPRFQKIFDNAGMKLSDADNKVLLDGHYGPHPEEYHDAVYDRISGAVEPYAPGTLEYQNALKSELAEIRAEITTPGSYLNSLITR